MTGMIDVSKGTLTGFRFEDGKAVKDVEPKGKVATGEEVKQRVQNVLKPYLSRTTTVRFGDTKYYLPTHEEIKYILEQSYQHRKQWLEDRFDCDDFSYSLKGEMSMHAFTAPQFKAGFCVGIAWGNFKWVDGFHAINWFLDSNEEFNFIEPQGDEIYPLTDCRGDIDLILV